MNAPQAVSASPSASFRVAVVGVGIMGTAIARRLLERGHDVAVFDLDRSKLEPLVAQGACAPGSAAEASLGAAFVITSLNSAAIVRAAVFGIDGVAEALDAGGAGHRHVVDRSSLDARAGRRPAPALRCRLGRRALVRRCA